MHPPYYRGFFHLVILFFFFIYLHRTYLLTPHLSSLTKLLYNPNSFFTHSLCLHHSFAHFSIFPTSSSRIILCRFSFPLFLIILSYHLRIFSFLSLYLTNNLIRRMLLKHLDSLISPAFPLISYSLLSLISPFFPPLFFLFLLYLLISSFI